MALADVLEVLNQYRNVSPSTPPGSTQQDFTQVAQNAPPEHLASGLSEAFRSNQTPPFGQMLGTLFSNSNGQQRAGILNQLLGAVGSNSGAGALGAGVLGGGALGSLAGLLRGGGNVTPEQANQVPPEQVQQLAEHAQKQDPSIVDQAGQFYAQHPTLVKALGAGSLALIMSHISQKS